MYQIIYIDIDEEITSVIDKLRKVKTAEVFLAIPKRALILQSIMSLKLLFREAERSKKHMIVVTQDPQEQKTVEKAGIETRNSLEGLDTEGEIRESVTPNIQEEGPVAKKIVAPKNIQRKSMEEIGSSEFYEIAAGNKARERRESVRNDPATKEAPRRMMDEISRERKVEKDFGMPKKEGLSFGQAASAVDPFRPPSLASRPEVSGIGGMGEGGGEADPTGAERREFSGSRSFEGSDNKEAMLNSFFETKSSGAEVSAKKTQAPKKQIPVSGKLKKAVFILFFSGILVAGGAMAYLFIPKAEVRVSVKKLNEEKDLTLRGDSGLEEVNHADSTVPVHVVEKEAVYTSSFPVTGKSVSGGKKAKGTVVIYNEFSSAPQPLVATTRLESADKKIFRLVRGVTVPGTNEVGGKVVPGAIEAEVIADASGEDYNIDPTTFSIPGFAGSPKFAKFSAKSTAKMSGGSVLSQEGGEAATLTQTDIAMAKGKAEAEAKEKIKAELKDEIAEGVFFSESVTEETVLESAALSKVGDVVAQFQYRVRIQSRALVFSEADVKKLVVASFGVPQDADSQARVILDYGAISGDFSSGTMTIKVHGKMGSSAALDVSKLKADLAGKSGAEIEELIKHYPQIAEIEINITPAFLFDKVPQISSRIEMVVD